MSLLVLVYLYATVAFSVSGYVYYRGVLARPLPRELELEHRAVLSIAAVGVGLFWVMFMPALLILWTVQGVRLIEAHLPRFPLRTPREARVRS